MRRTKCFVKIKNTSNQICEILFMTLNFHNFVKGMIRKQKVETIKVQTENQMNKKFCMSFSTGKDSTLALYKMIEKKNKPIALIMSIDTNYERAFFHGVDLESIHVLSKSLGIPVIFSKSKGADYREKFIEALKKAKKLGADHCAFGDIDIADHKKWCSDVCKQADLEPVFPLWQENRESVVNEFIEKGFKAVIRVVSKKYNVPVRFLGKVLNLEILKEFEKLGIDLCGENGEYHTSTFSGPVFQNQLDYKTGIIKETNYSFSMDVKIYEK